jgi:shikimate kinase
MTKSDPGFKKFNQAPIFLVGFMGAGKTTVGRALADKLGYDFFDLDEMIEASTGKTVREIFAELGERRFRHLERKAIESCRNVKRTVIALGGGAYVCEENRKLLRSIGKTVWLDCPLEVCLSRIKGDQSRPLLGSEAEMRALLNSRRPAYEQADIIVQTGTDSPEQIANIIAQLLAASGCYQA